MATLRTYGERCSAARALDLVGERWALLVVRELLLGPKRFTDLHEGMQNANPSVLSQRLRELEEGGVIERRRLGPPARTSVYELTELGRGLEAVMIALGRWGRALPMEPGRVHNTDALVLALKWSFDAGAADDLDGSYELRLHEDRFRVDITHEGVHAQRGEVADPDVIIEGDPRTLEAIVFDGAPLDWTEDEHPIVIRGDEARARRFLRHYAHARSETTATV